MFFLLVQDKKTKVRPIGEKCTKSTKKLGIKGDAEMNQVQKAGKAGWHKQCTMRIINRENGINSVKISNILEKRKISSMNIQRKKLAFFDETGEKGNEKTAWSNLTNS